MSGIDGRRWTRRRVLKTGGALALYPVGMRSIANAAERWSTAWPANVPRDRKVLVSIALRGGLDGLMAVPRLVSEWLEPAGLRVPRPLHLDDDFGLHPAFAPLLPLWRRGELAIVRGVGSPERSGSHTEAQRWVGTADCDGPGGSGWLNRLARLLPGHRLGGSGLITTAGCAPEVSGPLAAVPFGADAHRRYDVGSDGYPDSALGHKLRDAAVATNCPLPPRIVHIDHPGWDTHVDQARIFAERAADLATSVAAFWRSVGDRQRRVLLLITSEFGRAGSINRDGGTEHGHATCYFVIGQHVAGRRVYGDLQRPALSIDGLPVTTDFRAVYAAIARGHFGLGSTDRLLPGWRGQPVPLFTSS